MLIHRIAATVLGLNLILVPLPSPGQDAHAQAKQETTETPRQSLETLVLSFDLAAFGRRTQDPEAMLLAARLYRSVHVSEADFGGIVSIPSEKSTDDTPEPPFNAYLDDAEKFAAGNEYLLTRIEALRALQPKEVIASDYSTGPLMHGRWLKPGAVWRFEILVSDREGVMLAAIGDGDAVLEVNVVGERGEKAASSTAHDSLAVVEWLPQYESRFAVSVANRGSVESYVAVYSN